MPRRRNEPRTVDHPAAAAITLQGVLEAVADPVRRSIVRQLAHAGSDRGCGTLELAVARSTATHHFNTLREAGVIRQYYVGTTKMNALRREDLDQRFPGLLDALVAAADREHADQT